MLPLLQPRKLFTVFLRRKSGLWKSLRGEILRNSAEIKKAAPTGGLFNFVGTTLQDAFGAAGLFAQAAAFLRFR